MNSENNETIQKEEVLDTTLKISSSKGSSSDLESGEGDLDIMKAEDITPERTKLFIVLVACIAAFGGLIFGYDIAGAGATFVMDGFRHHFKWECPEDAIDCTDASDGTIDRDKGLINGLFGVGATVGALINSYVAEKLGRRPCLSISAVVFIIGASIQTYAPLMWVMWLGRVFSGMGIGMLSMCAPVYIAECSPEHVRGKLGTLWQIAITVGIVIASAANLGLKEWDEGWRLSYGGNIVFAIIMLICLAFMPESPRWLAAHGTETQLKEALTRTRFEDEVEEEMAKLQAEVEEEKKLGDAPWSEVFSTKNRMSYRVLLGFLLFAFQQLSGINAVMFYAPDILDTFFTEDQAIAGTFVLNIINFLATFITVFTVEKFGRTKLFVVGGSLMCPCLIVCGIFSSLDQSMGVGWAVLVFSALYIVSFAFSWGPLCWISCSEMFPYRTRGKATGITTMSHWLFTTIVGGIFPVASTASLSGCFFFFAGSVFLGTLMVYFFQVETAGMTSLEIDKAYANHKPAMKRKDW